MRSNAAQFHRLPTRHRQTKWQRRKRFVRRADTKPGNVSTKNADNREASRRAHHVDFPELREWKARCRLILPVSVCLRHENEMLRAEATVVQPFRLRFHWLAIKMSRSARNDTTNMKLVIAATGASGSIYLQRLLEQIDCAAHEVHLVMSAYAREVAKQELDSLKIPAEVSHHSESDMNVPFVSGSARFDAMVIVPCSMATLGRIASGSSDSVLLRAADVFLKERRKLILVPRETPWNLIHARNVVTLLEAGAIVLPAIPSFYSRPNSLTAVVDTVVWRILDQIGLPSHGSISLG